MSEEIALEAEQIAKKFQKPTPTTILKDISLLVKSSETVAIVGKSGVGKSTLLHILGTLEKATQGTLRIMGQTVSGKSAALLRRDHIGFVFQAFNLFDEATVIDNVLMPAKIARKSIDKKSAAYQRALLLLDDVELLDHAHYPAKLLSGGEKQRVALARALINSPELILADEPTGNLDRMHSEQISSLLLGAAKKEGKALVIVTHDENLAASCDKTYHLQDGVLVN